MNNRTFEQQWSELSERYRHTSCPMRDDELDRHLHYAMQESLPAPKPRHAWRYMAAAIAAVAAVTAFAIIHHASPTPATQHYAYSVTGSGIRVYCEEGCNADDILQTMNETLHNLD